jgi:hypothetical protein
VLKLLLVIEKKNEHIILGKTNPWIIFYRMFNVKGKKSRAIPVTGRGGQ